CQAALRSIVGAFDQNLDTGKTGLPQQSFHCILGVIKQVSELGKVCLRRFWHVLPELIAQGEESSWSQKPVQLRQLLGGLVPEVEHVICHHEVYRRQLGQRLAVPFEKRQATRLGIAQVAFARL